MKKDVLIKITGTQLADGDSDVVEVLTTGSFYKKNDSYYILYDESEATGFDGSRTVLRFDEARRRVTMTRSGASQSQLIIEEGRRHQCNYDTGYGSLIIGVSCDHMSSSLTEDGGDIDFGYSLDINSALTSENKVHVVVDGRDPGGQAGIWMDKGAADYDQHSL